jgi:hypothetical protein
MILSSFLVSHFEFYIGQEHLKLNIRDKGKIKLNRDNDDDKIFIRRNRELGNPSDTSD